MAHQVNYTRPLLYPKQEKAFFNDSRYCFIEASTKAGKSTAAMVWLIERALRRGAQGRNFWWVAPVSGQADIMFERLKRYLPKNSYKSHGTDKTITLFNGAVLWFKSGDKPDNLYGDDVWDAVIDEGSRMKTQAWEAVRSTLTATGGFIRIIGNVKGKKTWTYKLGVSAKAGNIPNASYHVITAMDAVEAGVLPREEIEDARRIYPEAVFNELYMCIPNEDGSNPFGLKHIKAVTVEDLSHAPAKCFGWDLAKSFDWTVGVGLDEDGAVCSFDRFQKDWRSTGIMIEEITGATPALIDSTGVGDPIVENLNRNFPNIEGFKFTQHSKQQLMEGLAVAIQQKLIRIPQGAIIDELNNFEFSYTKTGGVKYSAPEGFKDDCVMALALAVRKFNEPTLSARVW